MALPDEPGSFLDGKSTARALETRSAAQGGRLRVLSLPSVRYSVHSRLLETVWWQRTHDNQLRVSTHFFNSIVMLRALLVVGVTALQVTAATYSGDGTTYATAILRLATGP
ncbi:hypothetical protein Ae201684P_001092 [Aphanomyces euteiches]|nr:hypothetical protein Ae201684P_001092 [Aphanomyces euteiches]